MTLPTWLNIMRCPLQKCSRRDCKGIVYHLVLQGVNQDSVTAEVCGWKSQAEFQLTLHYKNHIKQTCADTWLYILIILAQNFFSQITPSQINCNRTLKHIFECATNSCRTLSTLFLLWRYVIQVFRNHNCKT